MLKFFRLLWQSIICFFRKLFGIKPTPNHPSPEPPGEEPENPGSNDSILDGIEHVVVVMMENRSFDNVLGWLYERNEARRLTYIPQTWNGALHIFDGIFSDTASSYTNYYSGTDGRFSSPPLQGASTNVSPIGDTYFNSPPTDPWETFEHVTNQLFGAGTNGITVSPWQKPAMNGFLQSYATKFSYPMDNISTITQVMEGYTAQPANGKSGIMPVMNNLARHYGVSDHWYCSVPTQTNANRAWMACGTSQGLVNNEGPQDQGHFTAETIWQKINGELSWKIYYEEDYFPLAIDGIPKGKGPWTQNAFPWLQQSPQKNNVVEIQSFHVDARTGNLPQFSFLEPAWTIEGSEMGSSTQGLQGNECHPPGDVRPGEQYIGTLYNSLIAKPEAWDKTLFIITFDEHGGLFDHIPPPPANPDETHPANIFQFNRYGVRVPTIFISPRIKENTVFRGPVAPNWDSTKRIIPQLDHTSIPATIMKWAGFRPPFNLGLRTDSAPTFDGVLNLGSAGTRTDQLIGAPSPNPNSAAPLTFGDAFYLQLISGEYTFYLASADDDGNALASYYSDDQKKVRFTFPNLTPQQQAQINSQPITHGSLVYIISDGAPQGKPFLSIDKDDAYYDKDNQDSLNQWVIKLVSAQPGDLGQFIYPGDQIFLENRDNTYAADWLPGKLEVVTVLEYHPNTTTTPDSAYTDPTRGVIVIEKA